MTYKLTEEDYGFLMRLYAQDYQTFTKTKDSLQATKCVKYKKGKETHLLKTNFETQNINNLFKYLKQDACYDIHDILSDCEVTLKTKLSKLEYSILKELKKQGYNYIVRNYSTNLYVAKNKPIKDMLFWMSIDKEKDEYENGDLRPLSHLFPFIEWKDENPHLIEDILNNCEIGD